MGKEERGGLANDALAFFFFIFAAQPRLHTWHPK